jgi:hypothetical protein
MAFHPPGEFSGVSRDVKLCVTYRQCLFRVFGEGQIFDRNFVNEIFAMKIFRNFREQSVEFRLGKEWHDAMSIAEFYQQPSIFKIVLRLSSRLMLENDR